MLKCQFHAHAHGDPVDHIRHSPENLIDHAAKLGYDVLAITCHRKRVFTNELAKCASERGLLLIPGAEFEINGKHILGINVNKEIEKIDSFAALKVYRKHHPNCLIIAAHPFFPGKIALKNDLIENIDLFDAIEISFAYTRSKNFNKKAIRIAHRHHKPLVATADCHFLRHLNIGYTLVDANKNLAKPETMAATIVEAIKKDKIKAVHDPTSYLQIFLFFLQIKLQNIWAKLKN